MSQEDYILDEPPFDPEAALGIIRDGTPEGYAWRIRIEEEFGGYSVRLTIKPDKWYTALIWTGWVRSYYIDDNLTPDEFHHGVLHAAVNLLNERAEALAKVTPDWAKLAKELQATLNGK